MDCWSIDCHKLPMHATEVNYAMKYSCWSRRHVKWIWAGACCGSDFCVTGTFRSQTCVARRQHCSHLDSGIRLAPLCRMLILLVASSGDVYRFGAILRELLTRKEANWIWFRGLCWWREKLVCSGFGSSSKLENLVMLWIMLLWIL